MSVSTVSIEQLSINTIRTLSMDAVQQANSGHPGTAMALAPVTYALWNNALNFDPEHPEWPARDRFVLSCGHVSMLLYSMLHLAGVKKPNGEIGITLENIKNFRQMGSPCAGHPEYGDAPGIETTTGPLGQGVGNSVGMAMAAKWFASRYDQPGFKLFDYDVYALCSDGDLMEGIGCEAASVAGHLKLSNLCWLYDDNHITIEGDTELAFTEDVGKRFEGLGWNVLKVADANDVPALNAAIEQFQSTSDKPTLIIVRSIIGYGSPNKANSHGAHGAPLGEDEIKLTKEVYGWPDEKFLVPDEVRAHFAEGLGARGAREHEKWSQQFAKYESAHPELARQLKAIWNGELPEGWDKDIPNFPADAKGLASRVSSGQLLNAIGTNFPWFVGGSADLAPSNNTMMKGEQFGEYGVDEYGGRNFHFGVREHAMASICNGLSLSGLRPYGGTFFVFTDYMRPPMRLASIMHRPVLYILTHDSIGLGEDGPTHQPVEHLAACRAIPRMQVIRPGDANEVAEAYRKLITVTDRPTAMVLTRQNLPTVCRDKHGDAAGTARGGYVLLDCEGEPDVILLGTGSEVSICLEAAAKLDADGLKVRVVSMPCWLWFDEQDRAYRDSVLPPSVTARVAVEAGIRQGWDRYIGAEGRFVGMSSFGASAPFEELYAHFGITAENVVSEAKSAVGK
ncbi:MAG: transketolase [Planctomycetaceae bacterium]|nr:transketolase [Planctomycetales bacterium]MCB9925879.1 transketolase [Planctomycetaceae bacterium]